MGFLKNLGGEPLSEPDEVALLVYSDEMLRVSVVEGGIKVYRIPLEPQKVWVDPEDPRRTLLIPAIYKEDWPYPASRYVEWFAQNRKLLAVERYCDYPKLREHLCSSDPLKLARAYEAIGDHFGFENLDSYPYMLSFDQARERFEEVLSHELRHSAM